MNTVLRPAGPLPARVYWVRRAVLAGAVAVLVLVLVTVASVLRGGADGAPAAAAADGAGSGAEAGTGGAADGGAAAGSDDASGSEDDATAADGAGAEDEDGAAEASPMECGTTDLTTTLTADAEIYPAGETPTFTLTLTNTSDRACTVDAGLANQSLTITSGADRIWSSADCGAPEGERLLLLAPGAQEVMPVAWPRVRSDEACTAELPEPKAGTYSALGVVAGVQSGSLVFGLG